MRKDAKADGDGEERECIYVTVCEQTIAVLRFSILFDVLSVYRRTMWNTEERAANIGTSRGKCLITFTRLPTGPELST
jgi:hypothetical protein